MAKLGKAKLIEVVIQGFETSGYTITPISPPGAHPARFTLAKGSQRQNVRVYIWNLSHGGGAARPKHEYRIQITSGISAFELEPGGATLVLGWSDQFGVFAAFDASRRTKTFGASPSIQISETKLNQARLTGAAVQDKGNGEFAVAVRPDRLAAYVGNQASAHAGNVTAILASDDSIDGSYDPDDAVLDDAINGRGDYRFGNSDEMMQRQSVLARLAALEREVASLRPEVVGRGHNRPPEMLPTEDEALAGQINEAAGLIRTEIDKPEPNMAKVGLGAKFLRWLSKSWSAIKTEAGEFGRKLKEKSSERAADLVIGGLIGAAALWDKILHLVNLAATEVLKWVHML